MQSYCRESSENHEPMNLETEVNRRRTFAIISHPDEGKTTLTEKILLYGGAVQLAGSVTARKNQRATTSDSTWSNTVYRLNTARNPDSSPVRGNCCGGLPPAR
jgi:hypothetical protein